MRSRIAFLIVAGCLLAACSGGQSGQSGQSVRSCDDGGDGGVMIDGVCL